ncbi:hypothetical protein K3495_g10980 [Podosphaera aphanis]|nr:hypothetical protein K3495_g10980 [Podosphaera aphanis]
MAAPIEERVQVPIDDPNADTEWNDILRKHGVIPEKPPSPTPLIQEAILEGRRLAHENRLQGKDLDELDELEDLEDETFLESYRLSRLKEIAALAKKSLHGTVYEISKPDYAREVTDASNVAPVLVLLTSANVESRIITSLWQQVAHEFGEIKFCEIRATMAIENYPERNCPTILFYKNGEILKQVVTLASLGREKVGTWQIVELLLEVGFVKDDDFRVLKWRDNLDTKFQAGQNDGAIKQSKQPQNEDEDDDWE